MELVEQEAAVGLVISGLRLRNLSLGTALERLCFAQLGFQSWHQLQCLVEPARRFFPSQRFGAVTEVFESFDAGIQVLPPEIQPIGMKAQFGELIIRQRWLAQVALPTLDQQGILPGPLVKDSGFAVLFHLRTGLGDRLSGAADLVGKPDLESGKQCIAVCDQVLQLATQAPGGIQFERLLLGLGLKFGRSPLRGALSSIRGTECHFICSRYMTDNDILRERMDYCLERSKPAFHCA